MSSARQCSRVSMAADRDTYHIEPTDIRKAFCPCIALETIATGIMVVLWGIN